MIKTLLNPSAWDQAELRERLLVLSRVIAGFGGGFAMTWYFTASLTLLLTAWGKSPAQSVLTATLWSFAFYTAFVIWAFTAHRLRTVWIATVAGNVFLALLPFWLKELA